MTNDRTRCDGPEHGRLAALHCRSIAVSFTTQGEQRLVTGQGSLEHDPDLGDVLRVHFPGHEDDGELLLVEATWQGEIETGHSVGCDFLVRLDQARAS
jgi:hypothetical protein